MANLTGTKSNPGYISSSAGSLDDRLSGAPTHAEDVFHAKPQKSKLCEAKAAARICHQHSYHVGVGKT